MEREEDHEIVYEAPDRELDPQLIGELASTLDTTSDTDDHAVLRAAMAHLNPVMIHPFSDGNGRMARCLQTLVLARDQILAPEFSSIEEYLGRNTTAYYDVLAAVGQGAWNPGNDALPWVRFCLTAHHRRVPLGVLVDRAARGCSPRPPTWQREISATRRAERRRRDRRADRNARPQAARRRRDPGGGR